MSAEDHEIIDLFSNVSLGAPENAVGFVLWRVLHRYQRDIDRELAAINLTHLQFTALTLAAWMGRSGKPVTQAELAAFGDIHAMQVSHILTALESKGMVSRVQTASRGRAKTIGVTKEGVATLRLALPIVIAVQRRLFGKAGEPGSSLLTMLRRIDRAGDPEDPCD